MRTEKGFRLPEPRDKAIRWPSRGPMEGERTALWDQSCSAWLVPGVEHAYGSPLDLVKQYGNDWYLLWIERAASAAEL